MIESLVESRLLYSSTVYPVIGYFSFIFLFTLIFPCLSGLPQMFAAEMQVCVVLTLE
jgi:hypothetical protein